MSVNVWVCVCACWCVSCVCVSVGDGGCRMVTKIMDEHVETSLLPATLSE